MNVTVKIDDIILNSARHRAVDSGLSLSGWLAQLIEREVASRSGDTSHKPLRLLEALGDESSAERDFTVPKMAEEPEGASFGDS